MGAVKMFRERPRGEVLSFTPRERTVLFEKDERAAWWAGFLVGVCVSAVLVIGAAYVLVHHVLPVLS